MSEKDEEERRADRLSRAIAQARSQARSTAQHGDGAPGERRGLRLPPPPPLDPEDLRALGLPGAGIAAAPVAPPQEAAPSAPLILETPRPPEPETAPPVQSGPLVLGGEASLDAAGPGPEAAVPAPAWLPEPEPFADSAPMRLGGEPGVEVSWPLPEPEAAPSMTGETALGSEPAEPAYDAGQSPEFGPETPGAGFEPPPEPAAAWDQEPASEIAPGPEADPLTGTAPAPLPPRAGSWAATEPEPLPNWEPPPLPPAPELASAPEPVQTPAAAAPAAVRPLFAPVRPATLAPAAAPAAPLLRLRDLHTDIGRYHILRGVSFDVPKGGVTMLLGRNGAGKTTTLRSIMGLWRPHLGAVTFDGTDLAGLSPTAIARRGLGYVPEDMGIFGGLTVEENMRLGALSGRFDRDRLDRLLAAFPSLRSFWHKPAGTLSGGQKQMLSLARAMIEPRALYLIDEPTKGLAPAIVATLAGALRALKAEGATILMVEQNFAMARALGDTCVVMEDGRVVWQGEMAALAGDAGLQERLMGLSLEAGR